MYKPRFPLQGLLISLALLLCLALATPAQAAGGWAQVSWSNLRQRLDVKQNLLEYPFANLGGGLVAEYRPYLVRQGASVDEYLDFEVFLEQRTYVGDQVLTLFGLVDERFRLEYGVKVGVFW